ncbi:MAG TPA: hypothetical protein VIX91_14360 [Candidatus Acidoferrum sp.]
MFGPRVSFRDHGKLTPFLQVLGSAAHAYDVTLDGCTAPGTNPGTCTVKVRVDDGRGGWTECSSSISVEPRPDRPPTMSCSADPYFFRFDPGSMGAVDLCQELFLVRRHEYVS